MPDRSSQTIQEAHQEFEETVQEWLDSMQLDSRTEAIVSEMQSLAAIYPDTCKLLIPPTETAARCSAPEAGQRMRYELFLPLFDTSEWETLLGSLPGGRSTSEDTPVVQLLVTLSPDYPEVSPPQLQLGGKYIGNYAIDIALFGEVTKIFLSQNGPAFSPGAPCVFDGTEYVLTRTKDWYTRQANQDASGEHARETERQERLATSTVVLANDESDEVETRQSKKTGPVSPEATLPSDMVIYSSEPITVSRSVFIGHAIAISDPAQVSPILEHLMNDKSRKLAKATHPTIFAYRVVRKAEAGHDPVIIADNDDDGESAAGGRLAHLLQILELENVLIIVSRWYGGTLLGAERFKLINQAAKDALELGGFLGQSSNKKSK